MRGPKHIKSCRIPLAGNGTLDKNNNANQYTIELKCGKITN